MRNVQRIACGPQPDARAEGSVCSACTAIEATSRAVITSAGVRPVTIVLGIDGRDVGVGLLADMSQQEACRGAASMLVGEACPLIIGQSDVQCSTVAMCNQHETAAETGIANKTIASVEATSLKSRVIFLQ